MVVLVRVGLVGDGGNMRIYLKSELVEFTEKLAKKKKKSEGFWLEWMEGWNCYIPEWEDTKRRSWQWRERDWNHSWYMSWCP